MIWIELEGEKKELKIEIGVNPLSQGTKKPYILHNNILRNQLYGV